MELRQLSNLYAVGGATAYVFVAPRISMAIGAQHFANRENWHEIEGAEGLSFEVLGNGYARDLNRAYFNGSPLSGSDSATLETVGTLFARDKSHVFCGSKMLPDADPSSFQTDQNFGSSYGWDQRQVYWVQGSHLVKKTQASAASFKVLDLSHSRDATTVYVGATATKADPRTFVVLSNYFTKDASTVFFGDKASDADPSSFGLASTQTPGTQSEVFGRDAKDIYYFGKRLPNADPATFVDLGGHYAKDNHSVYFRAEALAVADHATFEPLRPSLFFEGQGNAVAQDASSYYATGGVGPIS